MAHAGWATTAGHEVTSSSKRGLHEGGAVEDGGAAGAGGRGGWYGSLQNKNSRKKNKLSHKKISCLVSFCSFQVQHCVRACVRKGWISGA